jgi:hypothetical protein
MHARLHFTQTHPDATTADALAEAAAHIAATSRPACDHLLHHYRDRPRAASRASGRRCRCWC